MEDAKYSIKFTNRFKKDLKKCSKRGRDIGLLREVIDILSKKGKLPSKYRTHSLSGKYKDYLECHIQSDWLLVWIQKEKEMILLFTNTGTHSDIFDE